MYINILVLLMTASVLQGHTSFEHATKSESHVSRGLTDEFNHHRVKVFIRTPFRDSRSIFCTQPLAATGRERMRERERERREREGVDGERERE